MTNAESRQFNYILYGGYRAVSYACHATSQYGIEKLITPSQYQQNLPSAQHQKWFDTCRD
jgi:hypothetical protein